MNKNKELEDLSLSLRDIDFEQIEAESYREAVMEVKQTREKLGQFTMGYMIEAVYGDEYAAKYLSEVGDEIYNTKMSDIDLDVTMQDGGIRTKLHEDLRKRLAKKQGNEPAKPQTLPPATRVDEKLKTLDADKLDKLLKLLEMLS